MSKNPSKKADAKIEELHVRQLCRQQIEIMDRDRVSGISAKTVALAVANIIDAKKVAPPLLYAMGVEGIAQVARAELTKKHAPPDPDSDDGQLDAFGTQLNPRYSIKRPEFPEGREYVLREDITVDEGDSQVLPMLEKGMMAYDKHIDLFRAWNDSRKSRR